MNVFTIFLVQPLANGLVLFYKILGQNMGLAIIAFSLFLRVVLNPLTRPYLESMKKMKQFAPQLEKLKQKHKKDRQKLLRAQADFYKEKGINPGAGCLPYLLQIIILIALFNVFLRALSSNGDISQLNQLLYEPLKFSQNASLNTQFLYFDVTKPDLIEFGFLPFKLPGLLIIFAAIVQAVSAKISSPYIEEQKRAAKQTPGASDDFQTAMQRSAVYTFPILTVIIGMKFPSGLALYWLVFSLYQAYQQYCVGGWGGLTPIINKIRKV